MKSLRLAVMVPSLLAATIFSAQLRAAPASFVTPPAGQSRVEVRQICHHYRWSSKRHCTSAKTLQFVARPPLYYPSRYYGGRPHYHYEQVLYWRRAWYAHQRWHSWPYRHYW